MIGILGGTFDPIHFGHLRPALDVMEALCLDEIRFIPLRDPPHRSTPTTGAPVRLAMVKAAIANQPGFIADDREIEREGKSYTLDTLRSLREELGDRPLCLLLGNDAFRDFPRWHRPDRVIDTAHLVVMQRPGDPAPNLMPERWVESPGRLKGTPGGCILFQPVTQLDISATDIRTLVREGRSPRYLVPDEVWDLIQRHDLYR